MADHIRSKRSGRRIVRLFVLMGTGLAVSGCALGPDYEAPRADLPDRYSLLAPVSSPAVQGDWWRHFNDPVLNQLVDRALADSISLAEARERVAEAQAAARRDGVKFDRSSSLTVTEVLDSSADSASLGITLGPDLFGGRQRRSEAAVARLEAAEAEADNARRLLLSELALAYVELRFQQESVALRERDLRSRRKTLKDITTLVERGEATRLDQLRAQALVAESEATLPQLTAQVARQHNRLTTLLGQPAATLKIDMAYGGRQPRPGRGAAAGVPADLLRLRPDIRQAEREYAAAVSEIGVAEAARYPSLSLTGQITAPLGSGSETTSLAAGLTLPFLQQPELTAAADVARSRANQAYLQWRLSVLGAMEEVENALSGIAASGQAVSASRKVVAFNEEALDLSRQLLDTSGDITVLDLLDRERSISSSRTQLAQAERDYAADFITLNAALGFGLAP